MRDTRGPIELTNNGPRITRKIGGRVFVDRVRLPGPEHDPELELLAGTGVVSPGKANGFAEYMAKQASTGAGPDPTYSSEERRSAEYYGLGGGSAPLSSTYDTDENVGSADLFGQPQERHVPRQEYRDTIRDRGPGDAGYTNPDDYFDDNRASPTVDLGGGRSPRRDPRRDGTFARRNLK